MRSGPPSSPVPRHAFATEVVAGAEVQRLDHRHVLHRMPAHRHDFFEVLLFDEGHGVHEIDQRPHDVVPGSLFFLQPGQAHDCRRLGRARGWVVLLDRPVVRAALPIASQRLHPIHLSLTRSQRAQWSSRLDGLATELAAPPLDRDYTVRAHVTLLLADLLRRSEPPKKRALNESHDLLEQVFGVIDKTFRSSLSLRDVAAAVGRSPAHLTTFTRKRTGRTVGDWIVERRMAEARRLLVEGSASLECVAEECGYAEVSAFARRFRRTHGVSPGAWRNKQTGDPRRAVK